ncbi:hypothetical protein Scep_002355 [Stephania cephalantha]|uniref:Uncharacterized protein n=1 Tax=Stephania cephalantha TaxID=152367 RepID=A0AAP0LDP9_9MAGN
MHISLVHRERKGVAGVGGLQGFMGSLERNFIKVQRYQSLDPQSSKGKAPQIGDII